MILSEKVRAHLAATTRFGEVHEWPSVGSTNAWLLQAAQGGAPEGTVALADHQSAGRGRLGRTWVAPAGTALLVSVLLRPDQLVRTRWFLVTAAVALSARDACRVVAGFTPILKWPNDLLVGERKLGGILAEADGTAVVVGLGLNVSDAPGDAVSMRQAAGRPVDREAVLVAFLEALEQRCGRWDDIEVEYRRACGTLGRRVRVDRSSGQLVGVAEDIDASGALQVRTAEGELIGVAVGDVVHLRADAGPV